MCLYVLVLRIIFHINYFDFLNCDTNKAISSFGYGTLNRDPLELETSLSNFSQHHMHSGSINQTLTVLLILETRSKRFKQDKVF